MPRFIHPCYEYTVRVPNRNYDYSKNKDDYDFEFTINEEERPVIILFGWAGSTDKQLSTYSSIYEAKGLTTIRLTVATQSMFLWKHHIHEISEKIVRVIEDVNFNGRPIIIHCFSNGGSYLYQHFMEAMKSRKTAIIIKGVIFDSTPCRRTVCGTLNALRNALNRNSILNLPLSLLGLLIFILIWIIEMIESGIFRKRVIQFKPMEYLLEEENKFPQHFIYSYSDKVISYKDIEYLMEKRKAIGVDVSSISYNDTEHVKHYPFKKYTYTQSIFNFIRKCLQLETTKV